MMFEEPKVEFMPIELKDIITESDSGSQINICQGNRPGDDVDPCVNEVM